MDFKILMKIICQAIVSDVYQRFVNSKKEIYDFGGKPTV
jgi:hypothetical protein